MAKLTATQFKAWAKVAIRKKPECFDVAVSLVKGKNGLEIGGPSRVFRRWFGLIPVYSNASSLDNAVYSADTVWAKQSAEYRFHSQKTPGRNYFCEGTCLEGIESGRYDFLMSSHTLEHFANPIKALNEWRRVIIHGGVLILLLPDYRKTFDRKRKPTSVEHMLDDFKNNTQEDDLTHLEDALNNYDMSIDRNPSPKEHLHSLYLENRKNRIMHHHVFDDRNSRELLEQVGFTILAVETAEPNHIILIARF